MKVTDIMTKGVYTVEEGTSLAEVLKIMARHQISGLGVVDEFGDIQGVVSDSDIIDAFTTGKDLKNLSVKDIMMPFSIVTYPDEEISEAIRKMAENMIHRIFVVKEKKAEPRTLSKDIVLYPVGIISSSDIVRAVGEGIIE
ncbi:arabinose 5-phosphate isomerase KdsD [archaeon]|nr:arabinose 5-phosphate isomerase KdsD [archaeon]